MLRERLRQLSWDHPLDRFPYLLAGVVLMALKFAIDSTIARYAFLRSWSPTNYLVWPDPNLARREAICDGGHILGHREDWRSVLRLGEDSGDD